MQISSVQFDLARFTTDRAGQSQPQPAPPQPDGADPRTRQEHVRELSSAAKAINESGRLGKDRELTIALHRDTGQPVVRIVNRETREIIHQIPDERVLRMAEEFRRAAAAEQPRSPGGNTDWHSMFA